MRKTFKHIKTGVIGAGSMGRNHARVYSKISNLVAVSDLNERQGVSVANEFGIEWYENFEDMLSIVDAVTIAVPTSLHLAITMKVVASGVNVLIEKPMCLNLSEAQSLLDLSKETELKMAVGHIERHNPVIMHAKNKIENGEWGKVLSLSSRRVSSFPERITDVGVLFDLLIHDLDISKYLIDSEVSSVYSTGGSFKAKHEDQANVLLRFKNGIYSNCEANWLTPIKSRKLFITSSTKFVELDYQSQTIVVYDSINHGSKYSGKSNPFTSESGKKQSVEKCEPLLIELTDFLSSIHYDSSPLVTVEDGFEAVMLSQHALKSLKENVVSRIK